MATRRDWYKAAALALRDRIVHRWLTAEKESYDAGRKRVYYSQPGIPDRPPVHRCAEQYGAVAGVRGGARRSRRRPVRFAQMRAGCGARQWRPRPARGLLHGEHGDAGDPRHRLRHPLRFRPVPPDHRGRLAAGISRRMARLRQSLGIPAAGSGLPRAFRRRRRARRRPSGRDRAIWHPSETVQAVAYDTPIVGWRGQHVNALRLWSARSPDPLKLDVFNTGDYLGASAEEARAEAICKFLYPNDESAGGPRIAAAPGIFLRLGLAAGSGQAPSLRRRAVAQPRPEGRGAAQRHPSEPRRRRTDADPGRPAQFPLGRGLEDHGGDAVLHQPHAAAGSARDLAGRTVRAAAAAPSRNHLPHQRRSIWRWRTSAAPATTISAPRSR